MSAECGDDVPSDRGGLAVSAWRLSVRPGSLPHRGPRQPWGCTRARVGQPWARSPRLAPRGGATDSKRTEWPPSWITSEISTPNLATHATASRLPDARVFTRMSSERPSPELRDGPARNGRAADPAVPVNLPRPPLNPVPEPCAPCAHLTVSFSRFSQLSSMPARSWYSLLAPFIPDVALAELPPMLSCGVRRATSRAAW